MSYAPVRSTTKLFKLTLLSLPLWLAACSNSGVAPVQPDAPLSTAVLEAEIGTLADDHAVAAQAIAEPGAPTGGRVFSDAGASGGQAVNLYSTGSAVRFTVPAGTTAGQYTVGVRGRGVMYNGHPIVAVQLNGVEQGRAGLTTTAYSNFAVGTLGLKAGDVLTVVFLNDAYAGPTADRNAIVDHVILEPVAGTSSGSGTSATAVKVEATPGSSGATSGSYVALWSNGATANITVPAGVSGSQKFQLQARGDVFQGEPVVEVRRGGTVLGKVALGGTATLYEVGTLTVQPGDVLNVVFTNDHATGAWPNDRNALIDYGVFTPVGGVAATTPAPTTPTTPTTPITPAPVAPAPTPTVPGLAPANPSATSDAKKVLSWLGGLKNRTGNKVMSGQSVAHSNGWEAASGYQTYVEGLKTLTGKYPAFIESGYTQNQSGVNTVLLKQWQAGGLVGVQMHFTNPFTGGSSWVDDSWAPKPDLTALLTTAPANAAKTRWFSMLDGVAAGLQDLQRSGAVVMFRPLHEMNGAHFWWGLDRNRDNSAGYKALWKDTFNYLTKTKGLNNLLWIYGTSVSWDAPVLKYYPGAEYVDVVGFDHYENNLAVYRASDYTDLKTTGKPIWLHEVGPSSRKDGSWDARIIINRVRESHPDMMAFTAWHSWSGVKMALTDIQQAASLMNDPWVLTRDEVDWR